MVADKEGNPIGAIADDELRALRKKLSDLLYEYFGSGYHWADTCEIANFLQNETGKPYVSRLNKEEVTNLLNKIAKDKIVSENNT